MLLGYLDVNGCVDDVHHICEQLAAHVPRESSERSALTSVRPVTNDHYGFRGIGVGVWIAQRSVGLHGSDHTEPVQLHAIPTAGTNMPRQDGLIARQADLAIGKALTCIDVGAAALKVIDRKSTRLNSSHGYISYAVFCLNKKTCSSLL